LVAQVKIDERIIDEIQRSRQIDFWSEMQKNHIEKHELKAVGDNVNFRAKNRFLLKRARIPAVDEIHQPVNQKTDVIINRFLTPDSQHKKRQRTHKANECNDICFAIKTVRMPLFCQSKSQRFNLSSVVQVPICRLEVKFWRKIILQGKELLQKCQDIFRNWEGKRVF